MRSSLRFQSIIASAILFLFTVFIVTGLVVITNRMTQNTGHVWRHLESVQSAHDVLHSLQYHRWTNQLWRAEGGEANAAEVSRATRMVRERLEKARQLAESPEESALIERLSAEVQRYLTAPEGQPATAERRNFAREIALGEELVAVNIEEARETVQANQRWDGAANVLAVVISIMALGAFIAGFWALRTSVYEPLLKLRAALVRFRPGTRGRPAPERGAEEIREIARSFNDMASRLERHRELQLGFLASVAHEIRNPLNALSMAASTRRGAPELPPERLRERFAVVDRQVKRLSGMIDDLVDTTRIEAGQLELHLGEHDLVVLCREAIELYRPGSEKHRWVVDLPSEPVIIRCDGPRIAQVLNKILSNALKYSPEGGLIRVALTDLEDSATLAVTDQGIGISPSERETIFEPFRRSTSTRETIPGVGLGLSVARRIVEAHGGSISVRSELLHGSTFRVWIPRDAVLRPDESSAEAKTHPAPGPADAEAPH